MNANVNNKNSKDMRQEIEKLVNNTMLSRKRKDELIESLLILFSVSQRSELLLSAICQFTKRNTQKEIQEVEKWIETDFRK